MTNKIKIISLSVVAVLLLGLLGSALVVVYFFSQKTSPSKLHNAAETNKYEAAILSCYPKSPSGAEDTPIPNNSVQYVKETSRMFINMPKDLYPKDLQYFWTTVAGNATGGYISNGGLPGESEGATSRCWSTYVDFEGNGEVDLRVKSIVESAPDYFVRFIVSST